MCEDVRMKSVGCSRMRVEVVDDADGEKRSSEARDTQAQAERREEKGREVARKRCMYVRHSTDNNNNH